MLQLLTHVPSLTHRSWYSTGRRRHLLVSSLTERRIKKVEAKTLYADVTPAPTAEELELQDILRRAGPTPGSGQGAPSKRERRFRRRTKGRI